MQTETVFCSGFLCFKSACLSV